MAALIYFVAVSLDGFIAGEGGDFSAFPAEGEHMDVLVREYPDTLPGSYLDAVGARADRARFDTVVMGWNTYAVGLPDITSPYPHLRQFVCSRRHAAAPSGGAGVGPPEVTVTAPDPVALVRSLKAEPAGRGIWLCGGGRLAAALVEEIDHLVLKVNPLLLGGGIPLFDGVERVARHFRLAASRPFSSGVVMQSYARLFDPPAG